MENCMRTIKNTLMLILFAVFNTVIAFAQDEVTTGTKSVTKTATNTTTTDWYTEPWVWIVGGAVFILLLAAMIRGGSTSDTVVRKTTITRKDISDA